jgi:hypothetical protein
MYLVESRTLRHLRSQSPEAFQGIVGRLDESEITLEEMLRTEPPQPLTLRALWRHRWTPIAAASVLSATVIIVIEDRMSHFHWGKVIIPLDKETYIVLWLLYSVVAGPCVYKIKRMIENRVVLNPSSSVLWQKMKRYWISTLFNGLNLLVLSAVSILGFVTVGFMINQYGQCSEIS